MWVKDFTRIKRPFWNRSKTTVDKKMALLDLQTQEKGFSFVADGKQPVETEEGDGVVTLKLPHKTRYVILKHPNYGQLTWRAPKKALKKKKHYRATLMTADPSKEYQLQRQWVVFNIMPENAILRIDSTVTLLRQPTATFYLPLGSHTYQVDSPFYEAAKDSFLLTDADKMVVNINLQPVYSYLTVRTPWRSSDIRIDGQHIATKDGTSARLMAGRHRLSVYLGGVCCYETMFDIGKAEKKTISLTQKDLSRYHLTMTTGTSKTDSVLSDELAKPESAQVTLKAADDDTEILVDREKMGRGQWNGVLTLGYHQITTRKDSVESVPTDLWITDNFPQEVDLAVPQTSQGMLNIYSNVVGADIYINNVHAGETPCIVKGLPSSRSYEIALRKPGYKEVRKTVRPKGNDLMEVQLVMKKRKTKTKD